MGKQSSEWWCMRASDALAVRTESYSRESRDKVRNELARSVREGEFPADWPFEQPMKLYEEGLAAVFYFLTIGSLLWVPLVTGILLYMAIFPIFRPVRICLIVAVLMVAMYSPTPPLSGVERSRIAAMMMKYLSLTVVCSTFLTSSIPPIPTHVFCYGEYFTAFLFFLFTLHSPREGDLNTTISDGAGILSCPPHGILPLGNLLYLGALESTWGFSAIGLTTTVARRFPVLRHVLGLLRSSVATRSITAQILDSGLKVALVPGGVAEIYYVNEQDETIFVANRKGFIRMALQRGCDVYVGYCFGQTKLYHCWYDKSGKMRRWSRKWGTGFLPVWGRWVLPIPFRVPLWIVTARPMKMPHIPEPSNEEVDMWHAVYLKEVTRVFNTWKGAYGWGKRQLIVV